MAKVRTVFILGAGFSYYAGLPLQSDFTRELLRSRDSREGPSNALTKELDRFVHVTFGCPKDAHPDAYPELEDIFTNIDLAANTGHYLGKEYDPKLLRRTRRVLISRIIRMLGKAFDDGRTVISRERTLLRKFLSQIDVERSEFISLNWDTVVESILEEINLPLFVNYGSGILAHHLRGRELVKDAGERNPKLLLCKMHGSINWLYCENCRRVFSLPVNSWSSIAAQVLKQDEQKYLYRTTLGERILCPACESVDLGIRLATFSYQKALNLGLS